MAEPVRRLRNHRGLLDAAYEMARPVSGCLVNHDMKWDNIALQPSGSGFRPVLVDWELAGLGDPAWDLGCLLAEHRIRSEVSEPLDGAAQALLHGYGDAAGVRAGIGEIFAGRVGRACALRIAQLGLEVANTPGSAPAESVEVLTDRAVAELDRLPELTAEVLRCLL